MLCTSAFMNDVIFAHNGPYVGMHGTVSQQSDGAAMRLGLVRPRTVAEAASRKPVTF